VRTVWRRGFLATSTKGHFCGALLANRSNLRRRGAGLDDSEVAGHAIDTHLEWIRRAWLAGRGRVGFAGGFGADMAIECVGHPAAVSEGLELCRDGGAYLVLGQYADTGNVSFNPHTITRKQLRVAGSWGFEPRHVDRALRLLEKAKYRELFERQVTHRFPLGQANEALETVRRLQSGKALILPGAE
jgi:threonine dehydrogenase-like Zn-dependent dehydrogenase